MRRKATIAVVLCCSRLGWCLIDDLANAAQGLVIVGVDGIFTWDQDVGKEVPSLDCLRMCRFSEAGRANCDSLFWLH